jgi:hypothetical protein
MLMQSLALTEARCKVEGNSVSKPTIPVFDRPSIQWGNQMAMVSGTIQLNMKFLTKKQEIFQIFHGREVFFWGMRYNAPQIARRPNTSGKSKGLYVCNQLLPRT